MNNLTGIENILNLLKTLQEKPLSQEEIQERFRIKNQAFYKYLKYLKDANFDLIKKKNKFSINQYSNTINMDSYDIDLIADIRVICENILSDTESDKVKEIIDKILTATDSKTYKKVRERFAGLRKTSNFNEYKSKINVFENLLKKDILCSITIKSKGVFRAKPYKISYKKNKLYFNFLTEDNKLKIYLADRIIDIQPEYFIKSWNNEEKETIFEIYGNLAKTYILREDEVLIANFEKGIRIANTQKDKNLLFKRLLRYDILCKIIYPESDKIKFKNLIDTSLDNISGAEK